MTAAAPLGPVSAAHLKRQVMLTILALAGLSTMAGWASAEWQGSSSDMLRAVFGANLLFHPVMFGMLWLRRWSQRFVERACLLFAFAICAACMALALYAPVLGAAIDLQPLYLWIPVIHVFAFTVSERRSGLTISLTMLTLFIAISLPYLLLAEDHSWFNFTIQMHLVCAVLIAALSFFSSHELRLRAAQLSVDELARLANTDALTQLPNRRRVAEAIETELQRFARYGQVFSVVLIDVDHFKAVNDRYGHAAGDRTLVALARCIRAQLREVDMLGRWGGEEFLLVLPETGFDESLGKARALCAAVAGAIAEGGDPVTVSCGVTGVLAGDAADALLQRADLALYAAKRGGRNRAEGTVENVRPGGLPPARDA